MGNEQVKRNVTINNDNASHQIATFSITENVLLCFVLPTICFAIRYYKAYIINAIENVYIQIIYIRFITTITFFIVPLEQLLAEINAIYASCKEKAKKSIQSLLYRRN